MHWEFGPFHPGRSVVQPDLRRAGHSSLCGVSQPKDELHPAAISLLNDRGYDISFARSKSWNEFAGACSDPMDIIVTVCDSAASESCPVWPGHPTTVHWGIPDPAAVIGDTTQVGEAFELAYDRLERRVQKFNTVIAEEPDQIAMKSALEEIGRMA